MSKEILVKCQVIRSGVFIAGDELRVGEEIEINQRLVDAWCGKVKSLEEISHSERNQEKSLKGIAELKAQLVKETERADSLELEVEELTAKVQGLEEALDKTSKKNK